MSNTYYLPSHEYARIEGNMAYVGITPYAASQLGNVVYVDLEIRVDGDKSLRESHAIADQVHNSVEAEFPNIKHIMIHVNPAE